MGLNALLPTPRMVVAVAVNITGFPLRPAEFAFTVYLPDKFPRVRNVEAWPRVSVIVFVALSDCPVDPGGMESIMNVTAIPCTGLPNVSDTVITKAACKV